MDSLLKLPAGASYHKRSGQAGAVVSLRGDTVFVTATCDSLQREVEYYEERYYAALKALEQQKESVQTKREQRSNPIKIALAAFIAGLFVGVLSTIIILTKIQHGQE